MRVILFAPKCGANERWNFRVFFLRFTLSSPGDFNYGLSSTSRVTSSWRNNSLAFRICGGKSSVDSIKYFRSVVSVFSGPFPPFSPPPHALGPLGRAPNIYVSLFKKKKERIYVGTHTELYMVKRVKRTLSRPLVSETLPFFPDERIVARGE